MHVLVPQGHAMKPANPPIKTITGEPWEHWTPKVGQRVRIIRSAECPYHDCPRCGYLHIQASPPYATGTVSSDDIRGERHFTCSECGKGHWRDKPGHRFMILLDRPKLPHVLNTICAAVELTPLEGE